MSETTIYLKPRTDGDCPLLCNVNGRYGYEIVGNAEYRRVRVNLPGQIDDNGEYAGVSVCLFVRPECGVEPDDIVAAEINIIPVKDVL